MNLLHSLLSTSRGKLGMSLLVLFALIFSGCGGGGGPTTTPPTPPPAPTLTSIAISPTATIIKKAATTSYTATGTYSDGTTANITSTVTWASSNSSTVATISAAGVATGLAAGTTTITASYGGKTSPDAALTVITLDSIAITPATATVSNGSTTSFTATGTYSNGTTADVTSQVNWTSSLTGVATINPATGVATSVAAGGPTTITAMATGSDTAVGILSAIATLTVTNMALTSITINPPTQSVAKGVPATFTATGNIGDVSGSVTWASSDPAVATINTSGIATTLAAGSTNITASAPGPITSNTAALTVTAPALATLAITPTPASVAVGSTRQFTVSGTLTDGTAASDFTAVTWASSNTTKATITSTGLATGGTTLSALGTTDITATCTASPACNGTVISNTAVLTVDRSQMGGARQGLPMTLPTAVITLAGTGLTTPANNDGAGTLATFSSPGGITTDGTYLYVADKVNHTIRKILIADGTVSTVAGAAGFGAYADGSGTSAKFYYPEGITTDGTNLYVADTTNNRIRQIVIATAAVTTLAGSGTLGSADGTGTAATFSNPRGITVDGSGNLYVADSASNKIRKIVIATQAVTTLATSLSDPRGITTDGTYLYVTLTGDSTIRKIPIGGGTPTSLGSFLTPLGITTDGTYLYVANSANNTILRMTNAGGSQTSLVGAYTPGLPHGITTDGISLFVVESSGNIISKYY